MKKAQNSILRLLGDQSKRFKRNVILGILSFGGMAAATSSIKNRDNVFLVDIEDKYQDKIVLYSDDDLEIPQQIKLGDSSKLLAIVDEKKTEKGKAYFSILIDSNGKMFSGYLDGRVLDDKALDKVRVSSDVMEECNIVGAKSGLWLRPNTKVDHDTDDVVLLNKNQYVISSGKEHTSKDNSYMWKETVSYNGKGLDHGYTVSDFLVDSDFSKAKGKRFEVKLYGAPSLKLRSSFSTDSEIIDELVEGQEVLLIPNNSSFSDGKYDWFYVAVKTEDGIKTGYVAATMYGDTEVNYLINKDEANYSKNDSSSNKIKEPRIVNTDCDNGVELKLRDNPGLDSKIVAGIENGTEIFTLVDNQTHDFETVEKDGHKWTKVSLLNGTTGYVASEYLDMKINNANHDNLTEGVTSINFEGQNIMDGYFGIDLKNTTGVYEFESLISKNHDYGVSYATAARSDVNEMNAPKFAIFKMGATGYGNKFSFVSSNYGYRDNLESLANVCDKYGLPYGFYYYSQPTTIEEADEEAQFIIDTINSISSSKYNCLPIYIDAEAYADNPPVPTRVLTSALENGKSYQTGIYNYLMNKIREETGREVCFYTDNNTLTECINFDELDPINQRNAWLVNPTSGHSLNLASHDGVVENVSVNQIALDGTVGNVEVDVNFMDANYYNNLLKKNDLAVTKQDAKTYVKNEAA